MTTNKVARGILLGGGVFMHRPFFTANLLACLVLLASVNLLMSSPWEERVQGVEGGLIEHLSLLAELKSAVREVRVLGAIGVCKLHRGLDRDAMAPVQWQLVDEGVWLRPFGNLLYTLPPFNCKEFNDRHVKKSERQCSRLHRSYLLINFSDGSVRNRTSTQSLNFDAF